GGAASPEALQRCLLLVDQRHHDVAGLGSLSLFEECDIAIEDAGFDHAVTAHFQGKMIARGKHLGWHIDDVALVLNGFDRRAGGDSAHDGHRYRAGTLIIRGRTYPAKISLNHIGPETTAAAHS